MERKKIFEHVEKLGLDAGSKAFVFDALSQPADRAAIGRARRLRHNGSGSAADGGKNATVSAV